MIMARNHDKDRAWTACVVSGSVREGWAMVSTSMGMLCQSALVCATVSVSLSLKEMLIASKYRRDSWVASISCASFALAPVLIVPGERSLVAAGSSVSSP